MQKIYIYSEILQNNLLGAPNPRVCTSFFCGGLSMESLSLWVSMDHLLPGYSDDRASGISKGLWDNHSRNVANRSCQPLLQNVCHLDIPGMPIMAGFIFKKPNCVYKAVTDIISKTFVWNTSWSRVTALFYTLLWVRLDPFWWPFWTTYQPFVRMELHQLVRFPLFQSL